MKTLPKMYAINEMAWDTLNKTAPVIRLECDDNICSSLWIKGSYDDPSKWTNNIYMNSRFFQFSINPAKNKRWYEEGDQLTVELHSKCYKLTHKFRKYTGTPEACLEKIKTWIKDQGTLLKETANGS